MNKYFLKSNFSSFLDILSPSRTLPHCSRPPNRRSASSTSDLLQTKLRKLLNANSNNSGSQDSKDTLTTDLLMQKYQDGSGGVNKYDNFLYQLPKLSQEVSYHFFVLFH